MGSQRSGATPPGRSSASRFAKMSSAAAFPRVRSTMYVTSPRLTSVIHGSPSLRTSATCCAAGCPWSSARTAKESRTTRLPVFAVTLGPSLRQQRIGERLLPGVRTQVAIELAYGHDRTGNHLAITLDPHHLGTRSEPVLGSQWLGDGHLSFGVHRCDHGIT